ARWPMAKCGSTPTPMSPGSLNLIELRLVSRNRSSVVHCWPVFLTYCLGSSQIVQAAGGCSLSAYCVPQVVHMKLGTMPAPSFRLVYPDWTGSTRMNRQGLPPLEIPANTETRKTKLRKAQNLICPEGFRGF